MPDHTIKLKLNAQQVELLDNTVARGEAADRVSLIRRALIEFATSQSAPKSPPGEQ